MFSTAPISHSRIRYPSSSDFSPMMRPAPPTWRKPAGETALPARTAARRESRGPLMGGRRRRVLADRQHRGREHGGLGEPVGERGGEEGHRHREVARHHRDVGPHRPDPGLGDQRDADIPARHRRRRAHALGRLAHGDAVQHRIQRPPGLEPDEPGHVGPEYRRPRGRQHQQHRHREGADIEALEDDAQQRAGRRHQPLPNRLQRCRRCHLRVAGRCLRRAQPRPVRLP